MLSAWLIRQFSQIVLRSPAHLRALRSPPRLPHWPFAFERSCSSVIFGLLIFFRCSLVRRSQVERSSTTDYDNQLYQQIIRTKSVLVEGLQWKRDFGRFRQEDFSGRTSVEGLFGPKVDDELLRRFKSLETLLLLGRTRQLESCVIRQDL